MAKLLDPDALRDAEAVFAQTDEVLIAAFQVLKVKHHGDSTGTQLLKALGAKVGTDGPLQAPCSLDVGLPRLKPPCLPVHGDEAVAWARCWLTNSPLICVHHHPGFPP